jgi:hypothetical protein
MGSTSRRDIMKQGSFSMFLAAEEISNYQKLPCDSLPSIEEPLLD